jgi:hypothetical protein
MVENSNAVQELSVQRFPNSQGITYTPSAEVEYLGDAAYVRLNEHGQVVLFTSDGVHSTNSIYLEPEVLSALKAWLGRMGL